MAQVETFRLLLRENDGDYNLEAEYTGLMPPSRERGPYRTDAGDVFLVEQDLDCSGVVYGRKVWPVRRS